MAHSRLIGLLALVSITPQLAAALDQNGNQQSDVWEIHYGATALSATGDADQDGFTNAMESAAGTNPSIQIRARCWECCRLRVAT